GAAAGAFFTDFALVPAFGLRATLFTAVGLNVIAGVGALLLSRAPFVVSAFRRTDRRLAHRPGDGPPDRLRQGSGESRRSGAKAEGGHYVQTETAGSNETIVLTALALLLTGFAGMGLEIVWLRHFNVLLGGFRSVFSLVITIMLLGLGAGALAGGAVARRVVSPARALIIVLTLLVLAALGGLTSNSADAIAGARVAGMPEFWFNARPMLIEIGAPAILLGMTFPLGNAVIQHAERVVGRRAGALYLANTVGAVAGSLAAGYLLLPRFGMQGTTTILALAAGLTLVPLYMMAAESKAVRGSAMVTAAVSLVVVAVVIDAWLRLPESYILRRAMPALPAQEKLLSVHEGITEVVAVTEIAGLGRGLLTNGHAMSSTAML